MDNHMNHLATPWKFRDGKEYLVSLGISNKPKSISVSISDKITAAEWSSQYDFKYIETLTQRTGNYKPFDTFVAMIRCAILKKSDAVTLDLMSYEDLITLREKKKLLGQGTTSGFGLEPNFGKFEVVSDSSSEFHRQTEKMPKKYLIVTYIAEFDKVHYPLKLNYTGHPDVTIMQQTILKLKNEVEHLRSSNGELLDQLKVVLKPPSRCSSRGEEVSIHNNSGGNNNNNNTNHHHRHNNGHLNESFSHNQSVEDCETDADEGDHNGISASKYKIRQGAAENLEHFKKMNELATHVVRLEQQLEHERAEHAEKMAKLQAENDYLHAKLKTVEASESVLQKKVRRLESVVALNVGLHSANESAQCIRCTATPEKSLSCTQTNNQRAGRPVGRRGFNTPNNSKPCSRNNSVASNCSSVGSTSRIKNGSDIGENSNSWNLKITSPFRTASNNVSRSSSVERRSSFNPTEYVKQKKLKQEHMAKMRMARIESRIQADSSQQRVRSSKGPIYTNTNNNNNGNTTNNNSNNLRKVNTADRNPTTPSTLLKKRSSHNDLARRGSASGVNHGHNHCRARNLSSDSQRSSIFSPFITNQVCRRAASPSPQRNQSRCLGKEEQQQPIIHPPQQERSSRRKTKTRTGTATRDHVHLNKRTSIDQLLDNVRKSYSQKDESKPKRHHTEKSERHGIQKTASNLSFDKLQNRLHTIQAFLGKGRKSHHQHGK